MEYLSLKKEGHIGIITLDRPPVNALNYQAYSEIFEVFELVAQDPEIWCVIFQAKNKLFCAGNDLNELDETAQSGAEDTHEIPYGDMVEKGLTSVIKCKVPVITCVHSTAVGAGFCIATYSDIVLAAPEAKFGIPEVPVGIIGGGPEASHSLLPKVVRYMALTGNLLTAQQAKDYNMVMDIVPQDQLLETAMKLAKRIISLPPFTVKCMKESLNNIYPPAHIADLVAFDGDKTMQSLESEDYKEALRAFLEKRPPVYHGR